MNLKIGIMTNKELAEWFGIKESSLTAHRKKKLEELEFFADFETLKGKVNIIDIHFPVYVKRGSKAYNCIKENFNDKWGSTSEMVNGCKIDTCSRASLELYECLKEENIKITEGTNYSYTLKAKKEYYGIPFGKGGTKGSCMYVFCKKIGKDADAKFELFTEEEQKIKEKILNKYYGTKKEIMIHLKNMVEQEQITEADAWNMYADIIDLNNQDKYLAFLAELGATFNCQIVRATLTKEGTKEYIEIVEGPFGW